MAKIKKYESRTWLKRRLHVDRLTIDEIAEKCGVSHMTIRRAMERFGLK